MPKAVRIDHMKSFQKRITVVEMLKNAIFINNANVA